MSSTNLKYCLDANVLIQAWQTYYSPKFCPDYWTLLNQLGENDRIFLPQMVFEEITRTEDALCAWLKQSNIPISRISEPVTICLRRIYETDPSHHFLVDNTKQRSLADPWVIAHAMHENACVVTKEAKVTSLNTPKVKIPNVCENMKVRCVNDFQLIEELKMHFTCALK